jgi:hypothetical protein
MYAFQINIHQPTKSKINRQVQQKQHSLHSCTRLCRISKEQFGHAHKCTNNLRRNLTNLLITIINEN